MISQSFCFCPTYCYRHAMSWWDIWSIIISCVVRVKNDEMSHKLRFELKEICGQADLHWWPFSCSHDKGSMMFMCKICIVYTYNIRSENWNSLNWFWETSIILYNINWLKFISIANGLLRLKWSWCRSDWDRKMRKKLVRPRGTLPPVLQKPN